MNNEELVALLRDLAEHIILTPRVFKDSDVELLRRAKKAITQAEAQPEAIFTMEQFGGLVGLAREHQRAHAVVYKAADCRGDTCYFGVKSAALAWAKSGKVEEVPVRDLRVVPTPQPAAPAVPDEAELKFLDEWLTFATEPVGLQCCGRSRGGECCMDPEPTYPSRNEVIDAMAARHRELTAMLAAAPEVKP